MKKTAKFLATAAALLFVGMGVQAQNSVLSSGDWYKISVEQTGVHQITYDDLVSYGIDPGQINPKQIRLYGNGNGMLPEANDEFRYDDLQENAIFVSGEDDGVFDPGDFILFYGEGPNAWKLSEETGLFEHQVNLYSDYTYYFLNFDLGDGKRITDIEEPIGDPTINVSSFDNYFAHELDLENLINSGKDWYGEKFSETTNYNFDLDFPGLVPDQNVHLKFGVANRSDVDAHMELSVDGASVFSLPLPSNTNSIVYARKEYDIATFPLNSTAFDLGFTYDMPTDTSMAWLDYFEFNYKAELAQNENQFNFRDISSVGEGNISRFEIANADATIEVWDATDPLNVGRVNGSFTGSDFGFKIETETLHEFVAFNEEGFLTPGFSGMTENQNLHGADPVDFVIISNEQFLDAATWLAQFHETNDGLSWMLVTPNQIYNEFSSGAQDVTAIRDFIRKMYTDSEGEQPRYLLLFGDASYDPKSRIANNTNYVPTFQTKESLNRVGSIMTDDYFGFLDEDEGDDASGILDVGIGRIPVGTPVEASDFLNKIIHYSTSNETFGDWKNNVCFAADDADGNLHLNQADSLFYYASDYNVRKLYFDFYERVQTAGGYGYPEAKAILNQQIEDGVFYINYTGHGSTEGWAEERVLEIEDIQSWGNVDKLPLLIAASCEFTRFDDPAIVSGAETAILKNDGGVIGLLGCTRLGFSQANFALNLRLLEYMANPVEGANRLGDYLKNSKPPGSLPTRNFTLLGDPALKLDFPDYKVRTESVNGINISEPLDTINPADEIIITGIIADNDGNIVSDFSGDLLVKVFERPMIRTTLGNQSSSTIVDIPVQDSILMEFQTSVINGEFEYSFNLPAYMDEEFGKIKLSHYAFSDSKDANGFFSQIVVGGEPNAIDEHKFTEEFINFYPTIVSNQLNYSGKQDVKNLKIEIFDLSGKVVFSTFRDKVLKGEQNQIDVSKLQKGMYLIRAYSDDKVNNVKFVKQ
jgi:hypothetical protein